MFKLLKFIPILLCLGCSESNDKHVTSESEKERVYAKIQKDNGEYEVHVVELVNPVKITKFGVIVDYEKIKNPDRWMAIWNYWGNMKEPVFVFDPSMNYLPDEETKLKFKKDREVELPKLVDNAIKLVESYPTRDVTIYTHILYLKQKVNEDVLVVLLSFKSEGKGLSYKTFVEHDGVLYNGRNLVVDKDHFFKFDMSPRNAMGVQKIFEDMKAKKSKAYSYKEYIYE
jgi:hypothetical protein